MTSVVSQPVVARLTRAAIFLVVTIDPGREGEAAVRSLFVGRPPVNYDRLLDFSRAVTGTLFFVPSATFLESVNDDPTPAMPTAPTVEPTPSAASVPDGSLGVGSLKGENRYE